MVISEDDNKKMDKDLNDAKVLVEHLRLTDRNQVLDIVEKYIPPKYLSIKTVAFAEALFV
ncbi:hypothetical protein L1N85_08550 [Paenibacillus alkaliterrae]|uniref:hypothetical protein n=1 Tax=Paenibacillus alkaliterrae TaxID=320909 RepID=UPI001F1BC8EF|nr:hypothetical protein [Paenibacillus alkaliterrae]MCF2938482.1 hypothetical protein [Paenibacillus alkaliterrae]